ncbi:5-methylcytosine-specific restriction endonuclease McrBC regulatory subunit McrC [Paraburkholderia youngii]
MVGIDADSVAKLKPARETTRYNEALRWAQFLLDLLSPSLATGSSPAPAILFNMQTLFEHWVAPHERAKAAEGIAVQLKGAGRADGGTTARAL